MLFLTVFLARLLGLYCLVIALAMLLRRRETIETVDAMVADPALLMLAGVVALLGGLAINLAHNVWAGGALSIAVTVVGWVVTLKGLLLLVLPGAVLRRLYGALDCGRWFYAYMGLTAALGAGLIWASRLA